MRITPKLLSIAFLIVQAFLPARAGLAAEAVTSLAPRIPATVEAPLPGDIMQVTVHRLSNGITVYLSPSRITPRISAWIAVRSGSKHDPADCTGLAHYLEHMLFKGTEKLGTLDYALEKPHLDRIVELYDRRFNSRDPAERERIYADIDKENIEACKYASPQELDKLYNRMGFDGLNAFTMDEGTVYICDFPRNRAELWAEVETDRFAHAVFRLFQTELETVYEEKNMSMDNPERVVWETVAAMLYKKHPYGTQPTLGTMEHLKNPALSRVIRHFRTMYVPNNMSITLAGDFERGEMLALLERTFGQWKAAPVLAEKVWPISAPKGAERKTVKFESEEKVVVAWLAPNNKDADNDAMKVMGMMMDNGTTGIINLELNQAQKVKSAFGYYSGSNDSGEYYLVAVPKKGQTPQQAEKLLLDCVARLKAGKFTDEDIKAVVTNFEAGEKRELEDNGNRVNRMTMSFITFEEWARTAGWLERFRKVTKQDVVRVARKYLGGNRVVVIRKNAKPELPTITKPKFTKVAMDDSRKSQYFWKLAGMTAVPIEPRWLAEGTDYRVSDRPFGRLYTGPNPMNDLFSMTIGFTFGTGEEREIGAAMDLLGLAGAGKLNAADYKRKLYALGAWSDISYADRWVVVSLGGLEKNMEEALRLVMERFSSPRLEKRDLAKMIDVGIGAHRDNKTNPGYILYALYEYASRGPKSLVLNELSDRELKKLQEKRMLALAGSIWEYPRMVQYVGNRSHEDVAAMMENMTPMPVKPARAKRTMQVVKPGKNRLLFTHRDMIQSQIELYWADGILDTSRIVDYGYYGNYMGGSMGGVIFQEIREARGLAYSAWGGYSQGHWAGDDNRVVAVTSTQADKTIEAAVLLDRLMREPPMSATRFTETRKYLEEAYRTSPIHFREAPFSVLRWEEQGINGGDPRPAWFERTKAYRLEDLKAFSDRFKAVQGTIVVLGNKERVDMQKLKELGEFELVPLDRIFPY